MDIDNEDDCQHAMMMNKCRWYVTKQCRKCGSYFPLKEEEWNIPENESSPLFCYRCREMALFNENGL